MKQHKITIIFLSLLIAILLFGQQSDQTLAPQSIKNQLQELNQEIQKQHYTFTVGYNPAHQYTLKELCGLRVPANWWSTAREKSIQARQPQKLQAETLAIPSKWDWREHNGVTEIRNQGSCGSCWAFGTIGSFESLLKIKQDTIVDLSEQHLVSCNEWDWGCDGGFWAHDMLLNPGAVLESDFRYVASDIACGGPYHYPFKLGGWSYIDGDNKVPSTEKIKEAILNYGPVCAAVYVGTAFQAYSGGVFNKEESKSSGWFSCSGSQQDPNHGIMLVGWDDAKSAWILRNSWGPGWGEGGYMYIKYGINLVGYAAVVVY